MSYARGEKERRIMEKSGILKNKLFLYLTEFFAGMSVMAVELGASRLLAPYFSSSQIVWTIIIGTIMIAMALGNIYGGKSAAGPGQTVPQNTDRCDLDRTDTGRRKIHYPWNIGTADLYRQQQFPHYCRICGMYGDFCIPTVFTRHSDAIPCEILGGQS